MQAIDYFVPQYAGLHDIALFHGSQLVASLPREFKADARNPLDLISVVDLGIDGALLSIAEIGDGLGLAEIDAADQLAQNHDVEPFDRFALEARCVGE